MGIEEKIFPLEELRSFTADRVVGRFVEQNRAEDCSLRVLIARRCSLVLIAVPSPGQLTSTALRWIRLAWSRWLIVVRVVTEEPLDFSPGDIDTASNPKRFDLPSRNSVIN